MLIRAILCQTHHTIIDSPSPLMLFLLICCKITGDCDDDSECVGDLICYNRQKYDPVPGCSGFGTLGFDYCTIASPDSSTTTTESSLFANGDREESLSGVATIGMSGGVAGVLAVLLGGLWMQWY